MTTIAQTIVIESTVEKIHSYIARVDRWGGWVSGLGDITRLEGDGSPGTVVHQAYSLMGNDFEVRTTVKEDEGTPDGGHRWRYEREGGLPGWQTIVLKPNDSRTLVTSELEYEVPGGAVGRAADHLGVKAAVEHSLRHTLESLKRLVEEDWVMGLAENDEEWPQICDS